MGVATNGSPTWYLYYLVLPVVSTTVPVVLLVPVVHFFNGEITRETPTPLFYLWKESSSEVFLHVSMWLQTWEDLSIGSLCSYFSSVFPHRIQWKAHPSGGDKGPSIQGPIPSDNSYQRYYSSPLTALTTQYSTLCCHYR